MAVGSVVVLMTMVLKGVGNCSCGTYICIGGFLSSAYCETSLTTPTTVRHGCGFFSLPGNLMRLPSGSSLGHNWPAIVLLISAILDESGPSCSVIERPFSKGISIARRYPGEAM